MKVDTIKATIIFAALTLSQLALFAQAGPPGPGSGAPIDGGVLLLVLGAAAYGYKKINAEKVKEEV